MSYVRQTDRESCSSDRCFQRNRKSDRTAVWQQEGAAVVINYNGSKERAAGSESRD